MPRRKDRKTRLRIPFLGETGYTAAACSCEKHRVMLTRIPSRTDICASICSPVVSKSAKTSMDTAASPTSGEIVSTIFLYSCNSSLVLNLCPDEINRDETLRYRQVGFSPAIVGHCWRVYRRNLPNTEALLPLCPSLGNNTQIPAKDRWELRITFEHAVHSAMPPDTSIL
jgi:hypothetical protein